MAVRDAIRRSPIITFGVLLALVWLLFAGTGVLGAMDLTAGSVGQGAVGGVVGLLVIAAALVLLVVVLGEAGESGPAPETWPPER